MPGFNVAPLLSAVERIKTASILAPLLALCVIFGVVDVNIPALVQYLYDSADIIAFWNYVPLVYCVKSRLSARELVIKLRPFFPQETGLFVMEVTPSYMDGFLPEEAWRWFYLDH